MEDRPFVYPSRCMELCPCWQPDGTCARVDETNIARPQIWCTDVGCERIPGQIELKHKPECYWGNPKILVVPVVINDEDLTA